MRLKTSILLLAVLLWSCNSDDSSDPMPDVQPPSTTDPTPNLPPLVVVENTGAPCQNGMAGSYPCNGFDLLAHISLEVFGSQAANDNWGWTDPQTGKEYVLNGLTDGVGFIDISEPTAPIYIGKLASSRSGNGDIWRDIKVFNNHAFIVSEIDGHGMQVFDLTRLRNVENFTSFQHDALLTSFGGAHNIAINTTSGYAYVVGSDDYAGGPKFININDPDNPSDVGGFEAAGYTHDAHVFSYQGPDPDHQGKEIYLGSNSEGNRNNNRLVVVDVTDKSNPALISEIEYNNHGYTHQVWMDEEHQYAYLGDELDENNFGNNTRTFVFDLSDLDSPTLHHIYEGATRAIDHNGYIKDDSFFLANYTAGMREIDISDIANGNMNEIRFFDTYPAHNNASFDGVWNVYPFFESGVIAINDSNNGLFLVRASE
ncbi:MAG: choice-of-anchor B family protein [Flavobacteriaceae bacterium]